MVTVRDIYDFLDEMAPFDLVAEVDNSGLLVGGFENEVHKVLLSLDITNEVVREAHELGAELIISHHPVIYNPIKFLDTKSVPYNLAKFGVNAICAHINLDVCPGGVSHCLAQRLNLKNLKNLTYFLKGDKPLGFIGDLENEMQAKDFTLYVKNQLDCEGARYTYVEKTIKKVAVCSGAGGECVHDAVKKGADAFVTGEIKHHEILVANSENLMIVAAGHYKSEDVVMGPLKDALSNHFKDVEFYRTKVFTDKINYL